MLTQIKGLHHVTSMARDAAENNHFFSKTLGLRRVPPLLQNCHENQCCVSEIPPKIFEIRLRLNLKSLF